MFVAAAALVGRTVGDALFLERYSASNLAYMYPATALTVSLVAYGYARLASRWPLARLVSALAILLGAMCLVLRFALSLPNDNAARVAAYLVGDLVVNLPMILFWCFAAQCFVPGQAKRLFGLVGAGGTTACILAGFVIKPYAAAFGTPNLLILIALLMVGFAAIVYRTSSRDGIGRQTPVTAEGAIGSLTSLLSNRQIRAIVGLMLVATAALTLVDYQFKAGARMSVAPNELASFFGSFYGAASAVSLVIQLFIVHRVLQTGGVFAGLVVLPIALVLTSAATWLSQSFQWTVTTKFVVQIFAFTIDSASLQMLYLGIARQTRSQARALAEGIGKPLATGLAGLCLILGAEISALYKLALVAALISLVWTLLARVNHNAYIRSLAESLGKKQFDVSQETTALHDIALESHIRDSLQSANDEEVVYLMGILPTLDEVDWSEEYRELLKRSDSRVKIAALNYLKTNGNEQDTPTFAELLSHADPTVREGAIDAIAALGGSDHLAQVEDCLGDSAPETRAAAIAALIDSEDLDRLLVAGAELKIMLSSSDPSDRIAAAYALGRLKRGGLVRPVIGLLQDDDTEVIRAALEACTHQRDPKLIPAITPLLANPKVAALAGDTLAEFGSETLDHLIPYIELAEMEGAFPGAQGIPPILAKIGDSAALPELEKAARSPDPVLRSSGVKAFAQMLVDTERVREKRSDIERLVLQELRASRTNRVRAQKVGKGEPTAILHAALTQLSDSHLASAFVLLDIITPMAVRMTTLLQSLDREGEIRSNAIEILENVLRGEIRSETIDTISPPPDSDSNDAEQTVSEILQEGCSSWVRIGALYAAGQLGNTPSGHLTEDLRHTHPVVRETALAALGDLAPDRAIQEARKLIGDESGIVRTVAKTILQAEAA